jgi:glycosyltransferase involved in cell wall biosynthesis
VRARRVCILTETYLPEVGGGERQAELLAGGLARHGYEVHLLTRRSRAGSPARERVGAAIVHRLPPAGAGHLKKWGLVVTALPRLLRLARRSDAILVCGFRVLGIPAVVAARLARCPCWLKADSLGELSGSFFHRGLAELGAGPRSALFRVLLALRNHLLRSADGFVAISSAVEEELVAAGVPPSRIRRIPNGVDVERFSQVARAARHALRLRLDLPPEGRIVVYTGRLVAYKGLPLLLHAFRGLAQVRDDLHLVLVGPGGLDVDNCEAGLRAFVDAAGLASRVRFTGAVAAVEPWLQAADVFVLPSEQEAFGASLLEAMACGLPVVATRAGGLRDLVRDGENGLVIAAGDEAGLGRALARLLDDAALRAALGAAGRRAALAHFAEPAVVAAYASLVAGEPA